MKKNFITLGCTFIFMVLSISSGYAQITSHKLRSDSSLWVDLKATGTTQNARAGYYGMDSTTFTGAKGFKVGDSKRNVFQYAPIGTGAFIRFEDSPADTARIKAFKFHAKDTIFISFSSKCDPSQVKKGPQKPKFQFDAASNGAVTYQKLGRGASAMKFHVLLSNGTSTEIKSSNSGTLDLSGVTGDTIKLVIDNVAPYGIAVNTQILLFDINIKQRRELPVLPVEIQDTLVVFYGRSAMWGANVGRAPVQVRRGDTYWIYNENISLPENKNSFNGAAPVMVLSIIPNEKK